MLTNLNRIYFQIYLKLQMDLTIENTSKVNLMFINPENFTYSLTHSLLVLYLLKGA
jgi:hypothetical protein